MEKRVIARGSRLVYILDGKEVAQAEFDAAFEKKELGVPDGHRSNCWPMRGSDALAVHPLDVAEAHADARKKGVATDFDKMGRPIFTDRGHRKKFLKAYGYRDRDGGYGD